MKGKNSLLWVLSVFLLLASFGAFASSIISGGLILLSAIGCNPLFLKQLEKYGNKSKKIIVVPMFLLLTLISACSTSDTSSSTTAEQVKEIEVSDTTNKTEQSVATEQTTTQEASTDTASEVQAKSQETVAAEATSNNTMEFNGVTYTIVEVDGGDRSGSRQPNVAVEIGFGDRVYWAFTNEYGQLVNVIADKVVLQDDNTEPVTSEGRYYSDEAKVPGTEQSDLDEGHVIADSLGGVSNAYNITPQNSTLNRNGDQAYMEKVIRDAGGCENFVATITYPDTTTQIPSHYHYEYVLKGENVVDDFDNVNPDEVNAASASTTTNVIDSSNNTASVAASTTTTQDTTAVEQTEQVVDNTDTTSVEVHITDTGKKYHNAGCRYLKKSDKVTTLDNAKALGLEPCSVCNPPQ